MHKDFLEFLAILKRRDVRFVIVGGVALAYYGHPRYTGDLDIWIVPEKENAAEVFKAVEEFFGTEIAAITPDEFVSGNNMMTLGEEPVQIQIHTKLDGVTTQEIWDNRSDGNFGDVSVSYIGKEVFIKNKRAVGRTQDLADIEKLCE
jgi:hypothetical protein